MRSGGGPAPALSSDVIVVGSGVAGLRAAIAVAHAGLGVVLLAKDSATDSNTQKAQGGVAVALSDEDEVGLHYADTINAGAGLCDESAVRAMVAEGPRLISELIEWGAEFDREGTRLALTREGAHSARRILHARGDSTGREILRALWSRASKYPGIAFHPHTHTIDLIVEKGEVRGLWALDETTGNLLRLHSSAVVLACGGAGRVYRETTNPSWATGDGIAIGWRAGARLRDMEFVQFHPTALHVGGAPRFLLSEALRGEGGRLLSVDGRRFMLDVDERAELAPRDAVSRAIVEDMRRAGADHVLLDMSHLDPHALRKRFPRIHATCRRYGVDLSGRVPVSPAAHYIMGGVATDTSGRTSLGGLYAAGEVACSGVHGANRLASNSLLEGIVFGARCGEAVLQDGGAAGGGDPAGEPPELRAPARDLLREIVAEIRAEAWENVGIVREAAGLRKAIGVFEEMSARLAAGGAADRPAGMERKGLEAENLATAASLIARCALGREESRGAHGRTDFPARDEGRFGGSSFIARGEDPVFDVRQVRAAVPD